MSENHTNIESYQVYHFTQDVQSEIASKIVCFRANAVIGELQFYRPGESIPKSISAAGKFLIRYSQDEFNAIVTTFRESQSVNITFNSEKKELSISSGLERIG